MANPTPWQTRQINSEHYTTLPYITFFYYRDRLNNSRMKTTHIIIHALKRHSQQLHQKLDPVSPLLLEMLLKLEKNTMMMMMMMMMMTLFRVNTHIC